jgi:photosystem II protein
MILGLIVTICSSQISYSPPLPNIASPFTIIMKYIAATILATASLASAFAPSALPSTRTTTSSSFALYAAQIQFVRGLEEKVVPEIKLTRARDGSSGVATFNFKNPNVFDASTAKQGDVTGMFMIDDEGEISTTDVNARFTNGKPQAIESTYVMTSPEAWDRFMRFMEKYGQANGLELTKK